MSRVRPPVKVHSSTVASMIARFRRTVMPSFDEMAGFCSASLLVDRANGRGCSTARFDDQKSMMDAAPAARGLREDGVREVGFHVMDVEEFELAIAHLRVPELV